jgi:hypothetical protein
VTPETTSRYGSYTWQKIEHQIEENLATSWTPNPFPLPASFKADCVNLQAKQVSNMHYMQLFYPPSGNLILPTKQN